MEPVRSLFSVVSGLRIGCVRQTSAVGNSKTRKLLDWVMELASIVSRLRTGCVRQTSTVGYSETETARRKVNMVLNVHINHKAY